MLRAAPIKRDTFLSAVNRLQDGRGRRLGSARPIQSPRPKKCLQIGLKTFFAMRYESRTTKSTELIFSALVGDDGAREVRFERVLSA